VTSYNDQLSQYINDLFVKQDDVLHQIQANIPKQGLPEISIQPEEGRFLQFLVKAIGAKLVIEIGTLGGYSGVWLARGLSPEGKLITIEMDSQNAAVAREHFKMAGLQEIVDVRVGVALNILDKLSNKGPFDFVFIDADKPGYPAYLDWSIENLRVGGIVAVHNAFRGGSIVDPKNLEKTTLDMRSFNKRMANEPRLISTIFPAGDGTIIGVKTR
jgi:predicted O-methyltransferase YrrM